MLFMAEIPERKGAVRSDSPKLEPRTLDSWWPKILRILSKLGPGIVTGAADDDPSGIATYSQAGGLTPSKYLTDRLVSAGKEGRQ
jgi:hypothetical protein